MKKLWGGRFEKEENPLMKKFNSSFEIDKRLIFDDIEGSIAHAKMLTKVGILKEDEGEKIIKGLEEILEDIKLGNLELKGDFEDVHSFMEFNLIQRIGSLGKKLHTARSRNDQVVTDLKLFLKRECSIIIEKIQCLQQTIEKKALENPYIMAGFTHLQPAQVITFKQYLMAYFNMLERDKKRILNTVDIMDECPLGCCALAGTTYDIDREFTAKILGFKRPVENFLDGVSDRDFALEILSDLSILMMHLSRISEDFIIYSSCQFKFITLDDEFSTGSSIMPQKKNPDSLELIRGKAGKVYGNLLSLLATLKGLPLAYNKDMQEDKEALFEALDTVKICLDILDGVIRTLKVNKDKLLKAVEDGYLNATEVADYLVNKGVPFRDAHEIVGRIVLYCEAKEKSINELSLEEFKVFSIFFEEDIYDFIDYYKILKRGIKKNML
ncbi:MAG: argininosuccinate lyase [Caloramator sp.]|nr:argininosuccinate lyase [Caloramator sp.]